MSIVKSAIISCSRRTDVPAFLMKWVIERMQDGYVDVANPFNKKQISRVSLNPDDVKCWVWWSKNFEDWIQTFQSHPELFRSYKGHSFQFTINSPSELENNLKISLEKRFKQLEWLVQEFGTEAMNYRYDPIILYKKKDSDKILSNIDKFEYIIENVASKGIEEMIFSFATIYPKVQKRMNARDKIPIIISLDKKLEIFNRLMEVCDKYSMKMKACCQPDLLNIEEIEQAHCIEANRIERLVGQEVSKKKDSGQRKNCGCSKSRDIGGYTGKFRCKHNCDYCYASPLKY